MIFSWNVTRCLWAFNVTMGQLGSFPTKSHRESPRVFKRADMFQGYVFGTKKMGKFDDFFRWFFEGFVGLFLILGSTRIL